MLYQSERNHGCRFTEYELMGLRAVTMENELLRVSILVDKGTEIIEFNYKKRDIDFVWRSPLGLSCLKKMEGSPKDEYMLTDWYTGGWFECFPNVGPACDYKNVTVPHYGELWYLPWEYSVEKDEPEEIVLKFFVRTTKTPYRVEKILRLKSGDATLYISETAQNLGRVELDYQWGFHPNIGPNFIDGSCMMDMPGSDTHAYYSSAGSRFVQGVSGEWPYLPGRDGKRIDLRNVLAENSGTDECIEVNNLKKGVISVTNTNKKLGLELSWDISAMPHTVIWHVTNGDQTYPRYGNTYVLGFLPRSDTSWGLADSATAGSCAKILPGEQKSTWFAIKVFEG